LQRKYVALMRALIGWPVFFPQTEEERDYADEPREPGGSAKQHIKPSVTGKDGPCREQGSGQHQNRARNHLHVMPASSYWATVGRIAGLSSADNRSSFQITDVLPSVSPQENATAFLNASPGAPRCHNRGNGRNKEVRRTRAMNITMRFRGKLVLFALLSVLDFGFTYRLLHAGGGSVYEANPLANAWLQRFGWPGLALYKLLAVAVVAAAVLIIAFRRPRLGARLLNFACLAVSVVVVYSLSLSNMLPASTVGGQGPRPAVAMLSHRAPFAFEANTELQRGEIRQQ
jgi:hypothetical protein